ncbi:MAG: thioredoxin fold domain-containing protein [Gammaproteobacteria bacterium]
MPLPAVFPVTVRRRLRRRNAGARLLGAWLLLVLAVPASAPAADDIMSPGFDDRPLQEPVETPEWFKLSFLDLHDDLTEALAAGKRGLLLYFGQKYCPYCKALLENDFGKQDITAYTRHHFDVVAIDTRGNRLVTDMDGTITAEAQFAVDQKASLTPTLIFYDDSAREVFRLVGYHPPYQFRAALEYVADRHYRTETFRHYLARAEGALHLDEGTLNHRDFFSAPPHMLDRSHFRAQRPLVVFFEQRNCHACDVLYAGPLSNAATLRLLRRFDAVQLDMWSDEPVVTPAGRRTTARAWAQRLGLYYAPTLIFYDESGQEVMRLASVVHFYRLQGVLRYVLSKGYRQYGSFQRWRRRAGASAPAPASGADP